MNESNARAFSKELYELILKHYPTILQPSDRLQEKSGFEPYDGVSSILVEVDMENSCLETRVGYTRGGQDFRNSISITDF